MLRYEQGVKALMSSIPGYDDPFILFLVKHVNEEMDLDSLKPKTYKFNRTQIFADEHR